MAKRRKSRWWNAGGSLTKIECSYPSWFAPLSGSLSKWRIVVYAGLRLLLRLLVMGSRALKKSTLLTCLDKEHQKAHGNHDRGQPDERGQEGVPPLLASPSSSFLLNIVRAVIISWDHIDVAPALRFLAQITRRIEESKEIDPTIICLPREVQLPGAPFNKSLST